MAAVHGFDTSRRQVFVVGNEAADVDSLVSSYAMAQLLDSPDVQGIALAQIPREEFKLRGDALALFKEAGSTTATDGTPAALSFWDDIDWSAADAIPNRTIILTDHNKMTPQVESHFDGRVVSVLDHHAGGVQYPEAENIIDEGLGSCCSLVVEQFLQRGSESMSKELGTLLAGVILLDCRNFDEQEKKGTTRDRAALERVREMIPARGADAWYTELMEARKDISGFSARELMLLDMKVSTLRELKVAFASVFGTVAEMCTKAGSSAALVEAAQALARDRKFQAVILLFSKDKASGKKALAFVPLGSCPEAERLCADIVAKMLGSPGNLPDTLRKNPLYETQGLLECGFQLELLEELRPLKAYNIKGEVSRKTVLPMATFAAL